MSESTEQQPRDPVLAPALVSQLRRTNRRIRRKSRARMMIDPQWDREIAIRYARGHGKHYDVTASECKKIRQIYERVVELIPLIQVAVKVGSYPVAMFMSRSFISIIYIAHGRGKSRLTEEEIGYCRYLESTEPLANIHFLIEDILDKFLDLYCMAKKFSSFRMDLAPIDWGQPTTQQEPLDENSRSVSSDDLLQLRYPKIAGFVGGDRKFEDLVWNCASRLINMSALSQTMPCALTCACASFGNIKHFSDTTFADHVRGPDAFGVAKIRYHIKKTMIHHFLTMRSNILLEDAKMGIVVAADESDLQNPDWIHLYSSRRLMKCPTSSALFIYFNCNRVACITNENVVDLVMYIGRSLR